MVEVTDNLEGSFDAIEQSHVEAEALREEVALLKARLSAAERPALSGAKSQGSAFVERYLRKGLEHGVELKAMTGATDAAGGYAVPEEIDAAIERTLSAVSPIRAIASVVKVGSAGYRKLVTSGGTPAGWVSETAGRPETDTPVFNEVAPPFGELYANPAASQGVPGGGQQRCCGWRAAVRDAAVRQDGHRRRLSGQQCCRHPDRPRPEPALAVPAGGGVRDELGHRRANP
jgi:HK97 family phage major capsid protein